VVTITLRSDPRSFTDSELTTIREQIALLLHQQGSVNININIDDVMVEPKSGIVFLIFISCFSFIIDFVYRLYTHGFAIFHYRQIGKWLANSARNRSGCFIEKEAPQRHKSPGIPGA
jgi:hypothetical protein